MRRYVWGVAVLGVLAACQTASTRVFDAQGQVACDVTEPACLRAVYSADSRYWPKPQIDERGGVSRIAAIVCALT